MLYSESTKFFGNSLDHSIAIDVGTSTVPTRVAYIKIINEYDIRSETLFELQLFDECVEVTCMCRCRGIFFDKEFALSFAL